MSWHISNGSFMYSVEAGIKIEISFGKFLICGVKHPVKYLATNLRFQQKCNKVVIWLN